MFSFTKNEILLSFLYIFKCPLSTEALLGLQSIFSWSKMIDLHISTDLRRKTNRAHSPQGTQGWVGEGGGAVTSASPRDAAVGPSLLTLICKFPLHSHSSSHGAIVCKCSHCHGMSWQYRERAFPKAQAPCVHPRVCQDTSTLVAPCLWTPRTRGPGQEFPLGCCRFCNRPKTNSDFHNFSEAWKPVSLLKK